MSKTCDCGNPAQPPTSMCLECKELIGKREFSVGQKVVITRRETWQGEICTITRRSKRNPNMYYLREHGWRRSDEIEPVERVEATR